MPHRLPMRKLEVNNRVATVVTLGTGWRHTSTGVPRIPGGWARACSAGRLSAVAGAAALMALVILAARLARPGITAAIDAPVG